MQSFDDLKKSFLGIRVFTKGGESAPHKPLLLLLTLSQYYSIDKKEWKYAEIEDKMKQLLEDFGPTRKAYHPEYPFIRLINDGLWEVKADIELDSTQDYSQNALRTNNATGSFSDDVFRLLEKNKERIPELIYEILDNNFPETLHNEITDAIEFKEKGISIRRSVRRDPAFRDSTLIHYSFKCAVCGLSAKLGSRLVGIEAAHIKWHHAGGPDIVKNGLALCTLHHKLFDSGAFTINEENILIASARIHDGNQLDDILFRFHGKPIHLPLDPTERPDPGFLNWHRKNIFKEPERYRRNEKDLEYAAEP